MGTGWKDAEIIWHGAGEPEIYARDFEKVFEVAGINTQVHTLGPFLPRAWGLIVIQTENDVSARLADILQDAKVPFAVENVDDDLLAARNKPKLVVGSRDD